MYVLNHQFCIKGLVFVENYATDGVGLLSVIMLLLHLMKILLCHLVKM